MRIVIKAISDSALSEIGLDRVDFNNELRAIAERAAERMADASRTLVKTKAKHQTGRLAGAIGHISYSSGYGVGAYVGWEKQPLHQKPSTYQDSNGRVRKVTSVADVGGILEYSQTRQLRHMVIVQEAMEREIEDYIENEIEKLLDRAGL